MPWGVEYTDEFGEWWTQLTDNQRDDFTAVVMLLMEYGPQLPFPYSSAIQGSRHDHMRELRVKAAESHFVDSMPSIPGEQRSY